MSVIVFVSVVFGILCGIAVRRLLPEEHLSSESRDAMKLALGLIGTMAALVLGLLVASAKSAYDTQKNEITQMSAKIILLDRTLAHFGAQTHEIRKKLRESTNRALAQIWAPEGSSASRIEPSAAENVHVMIQELAPPTESARADQARALTLASDLEEARWLLYEQSDSSISMPFLIVLVIWLAILFAGFSLLAPSNFTTWATLLLCAVCVASSMFLILELDSPFGGFMQISDSPVRAALGQLSH